LFNVTQTEEAIGWGVPRFLAAFKVAGGASILFNIPKPKPEFRIDLGEGIVFQTSVRVALQFSYLILAGNLTRYLRGLYSGRGVAMMK